MDESPLDEAEDFGHRCNALALRLQQRRPRQVLADQGIIPPLKSPGTYFEQMQKLDRARKEDYLNHAIQIRPIRDVLVQKHILEDTNAASSLQAYQKDLKKAKLVDDLNDKIAYRPGVIELVERNILPATEPMQEALKGGHLQYKKISDLVDEDSSDALSPEQIPPAPAPSPPLTLQITTAFSSSLTNSIADRTSTIKNDAPTLLKSSSSASLYTQNTSHPYLSRQISKGSKSIQAGVIPRMTGSRKKKEKPKFKKFKYHQYVPPDQANGKSRENSAMMTEMQDDTPYTRLLQQQQLYLQLQIMNKQYSTQLSGQRSGESSQQTSTYGQQGMPPPPPPLTQTMKIEKPRKLSSVLIASKLDEMKVTELKEELKSRGLKVTGTKEVLIERLKPHCTKNESVFFSEPQSIDESSAMSPLSVNEVTFTNMSSDDAQLTSGHATTAPATHSQTSSESASYSFDPNTILTHKVARMPVREPHKIILKQEKFTMPTWNCNVQDASMVTMVSAASGPRQSPANPGNFVEREQLSKDRLLEEQQKEINDLRRMVELHRSQLQHLQERKKNGMPAQPQQQTIDSAADNVQVTQQSAKFEFPVQNATHQRQPNPQFCSSNPTPPSVRTSCSQPPNYDQAFEMLRESGGRVMKDTANRQMDDLLELLADTGELPTTPVVTRQLLNDHPAYRRQAEMPGIARHHGFLQHHGLANNDYGAPIAREVPPNKSLPHQGGFPARQRDFCSPDMTKMLVESAGDALMDTSNFPPVINSTGVLMDSQIDNPPSLPPYSRASARNSVDSGIIYSNSHYSPMDTNLDGSNKDLFNELRLSTSSLDSGEPTLNAVSLSPATPPRGKPHLQSTFRPLGSPRPLHNHLMKSASQELLSSSGDVTGLPLRPMDNDLGWLDLTLGSANAGPPSPGNPFSGLAFEESNPQHFGHHAFSSSNNNFYEQVQMAPNGSTGALNLAPGMPNSGLEQWDPFDGLLGPSFNS